MGADGCIWVCMGVVRHKDTNAQENRPARDTNGLTGYDSRPWLAGKFPQKRHICVGRHKGVRRDSGGWGWVYMALGACKYTQQTQNKANRDTNGLAGHNVGKVFGGKLLYKGWRGRHMAATDHLGEYWGCGG